MSDNEFQYADEPTDDDVNTRSDDGQTPGQDSKEPQIPDLTQYERFKLGEKEWTRDQLEKGVMFQSDYTKKTQEIAEERKYYNALEHDLAKVKADPGLEKAFLKTYPEKFHQYLAFVKGDAAQTTTGQNPQTQSPNNALPADPRIDKLMQSFEKLETERYEQRVQSEASQVEAIFTKLSAKYPLAVPDGDESFILSKAQALTQGFGKDDRLSDDEWDKIFKTAEAHYKKAFENHYKTMNNNQKAAHLRGKDVGSGGGVPGGAPRMPRTIKEATQIALEDLDRRNRR